VLSLLPFLLIILVFWFLIIRPQQKRQRAAQEMQSELSPGSQVMLTSGIFGTVSEITDDHVAIEVADGVQIKVIRAAIGRILPEDFGQDAADGDDDTDVEPDAYGSSDESVEETLQKYTPQPVQQPEKND
jgi:preprotein translocase subunit YajC